jgi:hypothetical protein
MDLPSLQLTSLLFLDGAIDNWLTHRSVAENRLDALDDFNGVVQCAITNFQERAIGDQTGPDPGSVCPPRRLRTGQAGTPESSL